MRYRMRPLGAWMDATTEARRSGAVFTASWPSTLELLGRETEKLGAELVVMQVDVTEGEIRLDGMLRSKAVVRHPGVAVSFESDHGPLRYATDTYDTWKANVRAIALALQALRAVDRYGVSHRGEQYVGWRAIAAPMGAFASADEAMRWMRTQAGGMLTDDPKTLYRYLSRTLHPDAGGTREDWDRLTAAYELAARR